MSSGYELLSSGPPWGLSLGWCSGLLLPGSMVVRLNSVPSPAPCCLWASHLYCCFTSQSFEVPWLLPSHLPGFLTLQLHSHTWRLGIQDHLLECWQAPALCLHSSPVSLCPSSPSLGRPGSHCTRHGLCTVAPQPAPPSLDPEGQLQPSSCSGSYTGSRIRLSILSQPIF